MAVLYPKYRHSVSSANLWRESPSSFIWRYGMQRWGSDNARTWMGKAAEAAYANSLMNGLTADQTAEDAVQRFYGLSEGEDSEHAQYAGWIAKGFVEQTDPAWGKFVQYAPWRPVQSPDLDFEISFKPDFIFENAIVDTKATLRILSDPSSTHKRQIAAYSHEWDRTGVLFYAAPQISKGEPIAYRHSIYSQEQDERDRLWAGLMMDWRQIEAWNGRFNTVADAIRHTALNTDSFYWEEDQIEEATNAWLKEWAA